MLQLPAYQPHLCRLHMERLWEEWEQAELRQRLPGHGIAFAMSCGLATVRHASVVPCWITRRYMFVYLHDILYLRAKTGCISLLCCGWWSCPIWCLACVLIGPLPVLCPLLAMVTELEITVLPLKWAFGIHSAPAFSPLCLPVLSFLQAASRSRGFCFLNTMSQSSHVTSAWTLWRPPLARGHWCPCFVVILLSLIAQEPTDVTEYNDMSCDQIWMCIRSCITVTGGTLSVKEMDRE